VIVLPLISHWSLTFTRSLVLADMTDAGDDADAAVSHKFRTAVSSAPPGRSVLLRLNADTSFLLSLAYPSGLIPPAGRSRFNILIDPWLTGPQSDVASWFSTQWHAIESSVKSTDDLNKILRTAAQEHIDDPSREPATNNAPSFIDAVAISHEFTDHCHEATLRSLPSSVPVFATAKAVDLIRSWNHFTCVVNMANFTRDFDWRTSSTKPLPEWVGISRLITEGNSLYYHSAVVISTACTKDILEAEVLIYTPHGVDADTFTLVKAAEPKLQVLAFLHGLHDVSLRWSKQLNLGAYNAVKAQRVLQAKYWVAAHDEVKTGAGLVKFLIQRKAHTLEEVLAKEKEQTNLKDLSFIDLSNGDSLVLA
jgi:hypothetical protein